jgi:hypothetical protein
VTPEELIAYYQALLIIQYVALTKAPATVGTFIAEVVASGIFGDVRDAFDLETAAGKQLDILGSYRGVARQIFGLLPGRDYFNLPSYGEDAELFFGLAVYGQTSDDVTWFFLTYDDVNAAIYTLNDTEYRNVIGFLARVHSSPLAVKDIDDILFAFFGADPQLADNGDMTITYTGPDNTLFALVANLKLLPKPAGVEVTVVLT